MNTQNEEYNQAINKLFHGEVMERASAARKLGHLKEGRSINLLTRAIKSEKDPVVVNRIIEAMGEIKNPKSTMIIVDVLKQEVLKPEDVQDKNRLFLIIESLMKIGDKRALEHLGILLNSCDDEIKAMTESALECLDTNWKENLKR
jgi:HEAT repeat protein